jgi:hypothetical protein
LQVVKTSVRGVVDPWSLNYGRFAPDLELVTLCRVVVVVVLACVC